MKTMIALMVLMILALEGCAYQHQAKRPLAERLSLQWQAEFARVQP